MRKSIEVQKMTEHLEDIVFIPGAEHRRAKVKFWKRVQDNPLVDTSNLDASIAAKFGGDQRIHSWWNQPGFQEWFSNQQEYLEKLQYAQMLSIDTIIEVLESGHASDTSKLVASKMVNDMTLKMAELSGASSRGAGSAIDKMNLDQLRDFISKSTHRLTGSGSSDRSEVISTSTTSDTTEESSTDDTSELQQ